MLISQQLSKYPYSLLQKWRSFFKLFVISVEHGEVVEAGGPIGMGVAIHLAINVQDLFMVLNESARLAQSLPRCTKLVVM